MQFTKINKSRHAAYVLHVHLVFITKYRKPILGDLHHASFGQCAA
ncbi:IS200/IS605 family transposase, partial [Aeromonas caviae]|nr:IS200/IS605 family transposase [Aeromonas caviae]NBA25950.1 IS200/IS605 family transposase [Aeromonas caviae]